MQFALVASKSAILVSHFLSIPVSFFMVTAVLLSVQQNLGGGGQVLYYDSLKVDTLVERYVNFGDI